MPAGLNKFAAASRSIELEDMAVKEVVNDQAVAAHWNLKSPFSGTACSSEAHEEGALLREAKEVIGK